MYNVAIIINSCCKFYDITSKKIIESAKKAEIPLSNIYIVVGEADYVSDVMQKNDYNIIFCKYINIDYNGVIYFTQTERGREELKKYTHFFYTHDTSVFMEHFWKKINQYVFHCDDYIKIQNKYTKNIGLFNVSWFLENKTELLEYYINYDKDEKMNYKIGNFTNKEEIQEKFKNIGEYLNEDVIFNFHENFSPLGKFFINENKKMFYEKIYSDEVRLVTLYQEPGIMKFQRNVALVEDENFEWSFAL